MGAHGDLHLVKAGLTNETLAALQEAEGRKKHDFLLVPEESAASSVSSAARSLAESLPQVWQDLFAATRAAQSNEYLDSLAGRPSLPPAAGLAEYAADPGREPSLGITRNSVFVHYLSPDALVQHHRLGKPEVRRLYQALQVYSLGFHQTMLELTAHAHNKGLLLLSIWRSFAMLWDGALQVVFPAEMVQTSRERQAALLTGERLLEQLQAEEARAAALAQENAALKQQIEGLAVQMLSAKADAAVAQQAIADVDKRLKAAQVEKAALASQVDAGRREALHLQEKLAALAGPQDELFSRAQQLERTLKEKQAQLGAAAKQAAGALAGKEEAQQQARAEQLRREAAERRLQRLQEDFNHATLQLRAAGAAAATKQQQAAAAEVARKEQEAAEAAAREDDTARLATERAGWQQRAAAAEAQAASLQQQLDEAQKKTAEEKARNEELVASLWPLAAKVKALEAAQASSGGNAAAAAVGVPAPAAAPAAVKGAATDD